MSEFLNPADFNGFLAFIGSPVAWAKASPCPCRRPNGNVPRVDCPFCGGGGFQWGNTIMGKIGFTGQKLKRAWMEAGQYEPGDVVCTIPGNTPVYAMASMDRLVFTTQSDPVGAVLPVDDDGKVRTGNLMVNVDRVFWQDPTDEYLQPEATAPTLTPGDDGYTVLSWPDPDAAAPPPGVQLSMSGRRRPEYYCFGDYPQDRRHHSGLALPRLVVLRSFDLYKRQLLGGGAQAAG